MQVAKKLAGKLALIVAIPAVALLYFGAAKTNEALVRARDAEKIAQLTELSVYVGNFVHEAQKERGRTGGFVGSKGTKFKRELGEQRALTDGRFVELKEAFGSLDHGRFDTEIIHEIESAIGRYEKMSEHRSAVDQLSVTGPESIAFYTNNNARFLDAVSKISLRSESAELTRVLLAYGLFLKGKERAGIERAVLSNTFANDAFPDGHYSKLVGLIQSQETFMGEFHLLADERGIVAYETASGQPSFSEVEGFRAIAHEHASTGGFGVESEVWFATITDKINQLKNVEDTISQNVTGDAKSAMAAAKTDVVVYGAIAGTTFMVSILFVAIFALSLGKYIYGILEHTRRLAGGDLTARLDSHRKDELGMVASALDEMSAQFGEMIKQVTESAHEVASAATEIAASSEEMATGLQHQESQVGEVSQAAERMAESVNDIAGKAEQASSAAQRAGEDAEVGGTVVGDTVSEIHAIASESRETVQSVVTLGEKSEQISGIIAVINEIADQTNLLALNAAIEAARAGEHGRGFAVVADEVRKLAERTTQATEQVSGSVRDIQDDTRGAVEQIEKGSGRIEKGVELASSARESLDRIVHSSGTLQEVVSDITHATEEQTASAKQISSATATISDVTRESAAAASQAASAAMSLSTQSERLLSLTTNFKVQG
jgi:methyl-accepting chemotaxis protein